MPVLLRIGLIVSFILYNPNHAFAQAPERAGLVTLPDRVELYYQESGKEFRACIYSWFYFQR